MKMRALFVALLATAIAAEIAPANAAGGAGGPAELPPEGFDAPQYVDSEGCVFVRAELDGAVNWVPRMTRDRKPVCGMQPTLSVVAAVPTTAETPASMQPAEAADTAIAPVAVTKPKRKSSGAKRTVAAPLSPAQSAPAVQIRCPGNTPVMYRKVSGNKVSIWCGKAGASATTKLPEPPPGYKYAFDEGRYNPNRGPVAATADTASSVETTRAPSKPATATLAGRYVQVGTYGVPQNATNAVSRLQKTGLPVGTARYTSGSKQYQVVLAGPFATDAQVRQAVETARRAGFSDAFPRR
ncbi:SPOR domain-containing protein [Tropicimonas marinistellae]|uniref:SPOR domain-containing protein n=1 Tax=Tropicimonas marinistellae TaxID=1739787 RepID=UPI000831AD90|nr:SPOR domain-containing protein [Tropicimonas marinistellae]